MPKALSVRHPAHHASIKLPTKGTTNEQNMIVDGTQPDAPVQQGKKLKQVEKRQAFLQKLEPSIKQISRSHITYPKQQASHQPSDGLDSLYAGIATLDEETVVERETSSIAAENELVSRSHSRRLKRKAKERLGGGLGDLHSAIEAVADVSLPDAAAEGKASPRPSAPPSTGKGSSSTLSRSQRKRVLELERLRHPLILSNSEFSSNPFQTIRTHAQNTMLRKGTAT